jgi:dihydroflavonol-4-reductase
MLKSTERKVLVTGATGYVGKSLVNYLIKNSYMVYVLTRKESSIFTNKNSVTVIIGDITDPIALPEGVNTIYHCAGVITDTNEMERVNVQGTQNIVNIALQNKCKLIHLSSAGVIGKTKIKTLTEETECHPHNLYELSKYKAEQIVLRGVTNGLKAQILRPTTIFGFKEDPKKDTFFQLAKSMRTGLYRNIGHGIYNIVHIDEVVMALIMLDEEGLSNGGVYQVNNTITYEDMNILVKNLEPIINNKTQ